MNFENCKILGGIGSILLFLSVVPYTYGLLGLVGAILVIVAMKGFADYYREAGIFNNTLYSVVLAIVGGVAFLAILVLALIDLLTSLGISLDLSNYSNLAAQLSSINLTSNMNTLMKFVGFIFLDIVVLFVFALVSVLLLRKALKLMSERTNVGLFASTGTILLIGAVLTIIAVGLILIWVSALLLAIAFLQIKPPAPSPAYSQPMPPYQPPPGANS